MKKSHQFLLCASLTFTSQLRADECTHQWIKALSTDPQVQKPYSGDTSAAYAVLAFWGDPNINLVINGEFPRARFMSFESHITKASINEDVLKDEQIQPREGSTNPFMEGSDMAAKERSYTIIASQEKSASDLNRIRLPRGRLTNVLMYRVYAPNDGEVVTPASLPRVFAVDAKTGAPTHCPRATSYPHSFYFPQFLAKAYTRIKDFQFRQPGENMIGLNSAANYVYALTPLRNDEVIIARFKAPTFNNTQAGKGFFSPKDSEVRYWSFCTSNFPRNQTLNCIPDHLAKTQSDTVTMVVGPPAIAAAAHSKGFNFLPDVRERRQKVMGMVYRNLIPQPNFAEARLYKGEYLPEAVVCSVNEFLTNRCSL